MTTVPRASTITVANADIGSATTINISRADKSFTHTLTYTFGTLSGTIVTKTSDVSVGFDIPTTFYEQIPNTKSGTVTLTCITYSGSTNIGSSTKTFKVTANEDECKPTISAVLIDSNEKTVELTGDNTKLIKYKSTAKITPTATAKNSASIKSITVAGKTLTGSYISFTNVQSTSFEIIATDSRGYSNSITLNPTIISYIKLSATAKFKRTTATSSEVKLAYSGNYYDGSFGSEDNTLSITWKYKEKGATEWILGGTLTPTIANNKYSGEVPLGNTYNYKKAYEFILYISDKLSSLEPQDVVKKGEAIYDWGVDRDGNNYLFTLGNFYSRKNYEVDENGNIYYPRGQCMTAKLSADVALESGTTNNLIALSTKVSLGDGLSLTSDGGIKIGKKISHVVVSAGAKIQNDNESSWAYYNLYIYKNSSIVASSRIGYLEAGKVSGCSVSPSLVEVEENDVIYLKMYKISTHLATVLSSYSSTFLTVEAV